MNMEQILRRYQHLPTKQLAERIEDELGLEIQYDTREVRTREGLSLTTVEYRPHRRYVTSWERID